MKRRLALTLLLVILLANACTAPPNTPAPTRTLSPPVRASEAPTLTPGDIGTAASPMPTEPPVATAIPSATPVPTATAVTLGDVPAMEQRLMDTPIFVNFAHQRAHVIFDLGASLGVRANVFTTVGDSNTSNGDFLQPIGMGADVYCDWGSYDSLHATVAYFSVAPDDQSNTSFTHHSLATKKGFTSAAALDPFWVDDAVCAANESPLACEYRTIEPSVAIIMLGNIDVGSLTTEAYTTNMRAIVDTSIQHGVIPVLTTFVVIPERSVYERSLEFNMALLNIAAAEDVPLINLWAAAQALPDHGIGPDQTHLKAVVGSFCDFTGAQNQYGGTLRNLLTLQALDMLRQSVLTAAG